MSDRPPTPPCVRFRTRRFNRISAETRTGQGYYSIRPVRVFLLKWRGLPWFFPIYANILYGSNHTGMPPIPGLRVSTGSSPSFLAASTVSRYTSGNCGAAIHPSSSSCFAYDDSLCSNSLRDPVDLLKHTVKYLSRYIEPF